MENAISGSLNEPIKFCDDCRYFKTPGTEASECHANPPVIVEKLLDLNYVNGIDTAIDMASRFPIVGSAEIACRFFEKGGN